LCHDELERQRQSEPNVVNGNPTNGTGRCHEIAATECRLAKLDEDGSYIGDRLFDFLVIGNETCHDSIPFDLTAHSFPYRIHRDFHGHKRELIDWVRTIIRFLSFPLMPILSVVPSMLCVDSDAKKELSV
jgi:hypothetical protein